MRWLLAVLFIVGVLRAQQALADRIDSAQEATITDAAELDPPTPSRGAINQPPKAPSTQHATEPNTDQRGTENAPLFVKTIPTPKSDLEAAQDAEEKSQKAFSDLWVVKLTAGLVVVGLLQAWVFWVQASRLKETVVATKEEFIATHRPRLHARNIEIEGLRPIHTASTPPLSNQHPVIGDLYISNVGGTEAFITSSFFMPYWSQADLPMSRPYEMNMGDQYDKNIVLKAGGSTIFTFISDRLMGPECDDILAGNGQWDLYVMGWIAYTDSNKRPYRTAVCRRYKGSIGRFVIVNDADYEHEE